MNCYPLKNIQIRRHFMKLDNILMVSKNPLAFFSILV